MTTTPNINAPDWAAAQATPWLTENERARFFDAFCVAINIETRADTAPPGSCADGACFLIAGVATGDWTGFEGYIAIAVGANAASGWLYIPAANIQKTGNRLYVRDENLHIAWTGSDWAPADYALVDLTGIGDGDYLRYDASNGVFYGSAT